MVVVVVVVVLVLVLVVGGVAVVVAAGPTFWGTLLLNPLEYGTWAFVDVP